MDPVSEALMEFPDSAQFLRAGLRILSAAVLGGLLGLERERVGKAAGLRTHMLVALGAAMFIVVPREMGLGEGDLGRVVQGIATGIGFIGAGTILKRPDQEHIKGLTTAGNIWLTAAIGLAAGGGLAWLGAVAVFCAWIILWVMRGLERQMED
jgi:putative Mg2+ transporter-C (MgtC) family protein